MKKQNYFSICILICMFIVILFWTIQIINDYTPFIDEWTKHYVQSLDESNLFYNIALFFTELGSKTFLIPFTIVSATVLLWIYRSILPSLIFVIGTVTTHLLNLYIKSIILRERPRILVEANAIGYSFPSGHAMIPTVCYGLIMYFLMLMYPQNKKVINIFFISLVLMIGISRVIINVHYPTDVITGFYLGFVMLLVSIYIYNFIVSENINK